MCKATLPVMLHRTDASDPGMRKCCAEVQGEVSGARAPYCGPPCALDETARLVMQLVSRLMPVGYSDSTKGARPSASPDVLTLFSSEILPSFGTCPVFQV